MADEISIGTGVLLAIIGGMLIGCLHPEDQVDSYVQQISKGDTAAAAGSEPTWRECQNYLLVECPWRAPSPFISGIL